MWAINCPAEPELEELMGTLESYRAEVIEGMGAAKGHPTARHMEGAPA